MGEMSIARAGRKTMDATKADVSDSPAECMGSGLFRTQPGDAGSTLSEALESLDGAAAVQEVTRHAPRNLLGARTNLSPGRGRGHFEWMQMGDDMYVVAGDLAYRDLHVELARGSGLIQVYFHLSGDLTMEANGQQRLHLNRPKFLIYTQPGGVDVRKSIAPNTPERWRWVAISLRPKFLVDNFFGSGAAVPPQLRALVSGFSSGLQHRQSFLSIRMFELAKRLVDHSYSGRLALIHTEALALELLCTAVAELDGTPSSLNGKYGERELRCLNNARELLTTQLASALTIREVARAAGMNETTLKRGFREMFGETMFDYSVRCRMQQAMLLLREKRMPVARVAEAVGYSHQTSFTNAFRRHYGVCPKDTRPPRVL
jgi:AraC-like DNA-binding protein